MSNVPVRLTYSDRELWMKIDGEFIALMCGFKARSGKSSHRPQTRRLGVELFDNSDCKVMAFKRRLAP